MPDPLPEALGLLALFAIIAATALTLVLARALLREVSKHVDARIEDAVDRALVDRNLGRATLAIKRARGDL